MRRWRRYGFLAYEIASIEAPIASITAIAREIESAPKITSSPRVITDEVIVGSPVLSSWVGSFHGSFSCDPSLLCRQSRSVQPEPT